MMKWRNSFNELFEKEMFLIDNCHFSLNDINNMCLSDFDLYYSKKIQKINEENDRIKNSKNKNNIMSFM